MNKSSLLVFLLLVFAPLSLCAQYSHKGSNYNVNTALPWVAGQMPKNSDNVRYKVVYGEGATYQLAREDALSSLLLELGLENGVSVTSKTIDEVKSQIIDNDSHFSQNRSTTTVIEQDGFKASITKVDEYSEVVDKRSLPKSYKVWQLYAIDCPWASQINLQYSSKYGFSTAGWRSCLIPGWGQFYKKQYAKGAVFLGAEAASIASVAVFQSRYNYNIKQSLETPILDLQIEYTNRAHKQQLYRNISIGACAAVWLLNVLDATLLDGRPRYIDSNINFSLNSTQNNEMLLSLTYNF